MTAIILLVSSYYAPKFHTGAATMEVLAQAINVIITALIIPANHALPVRVYILLAITVANATQGMIGIAAI